jgi:ATP-binding cassette, subfamily B, bacterial PglK
MYAFKLKPKQKESELMPIKDIDVDQKALGPEHSLLSTVWASFGLFEAKAKRKLVFLILAMVIGAVFEAVGAAAIVPFVALLSEPNLAEKHVLLEKFYRLTRANDPAEFIVFTSVALLCYFVLKNIYLAWGANAQFKFVYGEMPKFSSRIFLRYMHRSVAEQGQANSSELIRNVGNEVFMFFNNFVVPSMTLITEAMVMMAMVTVLLLVAPLPSVLALGILGASTFLFHRLVRSKAKRFGSQQQLENAERIRWITQGLSSLKEVNILGVQNYFTAHFNKHEQNFAVAARYAMFLNQTPRLFIETVAFAALFIGVAISLSFGAERSNLLPILALFAISAVRLLPSLNRILLSITRMTYYKPSALVVLRQNELFLHHQNVQEREEIAVIRDWKELRFEGVSFSYNTERNVLVDANLRILRGSSVALVGPSGAGKTTIADLAMGLLTPTRGRILLDDQDICDISSSWKRRIGYVPQHIYLLDDSVRRNVAFGLTDSEISDADVWRALKMSQLDQFVSFLPQQLDTPIGENGGLLSGGQRQRLGIARALYRDPEFIVLDEATSALDEATEKEIAQTLEEITGEKTLLIIAHRPETIRRCQYKYSVTENRNL